MQRETLKRSAAEPSPPIRVDLAVDHPGFHDPVYRARRDELAALASAHLPGSRVAEVAYSCGEHATWRRIVDTLLPHHRRFACSALVEQTDASGSFDGPIPQFEALNRGPLRCTGFRFEPVAGLVDSRTFFAGLARGVFLSTQYLRHPARPFYTPEPDVVHELVGHAASFAIPAIADLNRQFGRAAASADGERLLQLERLYWYSMEFGLVLEQGRPRAFGAGLLSSVDELQRACTERALEEFDAEVVARTPYDPARMNDRLFVAPSLKALLDATQAWIAGSTLHANRA